VTLLSSSSYTSLGQLEMFSLTTITPPPRMPFAQRLRYSTNSESFKCPKHHWLFTKRLAWPSAHLGREGNPLPDQPVRVVLWRPIFKAHIEDGADFARLLFLFEVFRLLNLVGKLRYRLNNIDHHMSIDLCKKVLRDPSDAVGGQ
jgi:hypothetical protein